MLLAGSWSFLMKVFLSKLLLSQHVFTAFSVSLPSFIFLYFFHLSLYYQLIHLTMMIKWDHSILFIINIKYISNKSNHKFNILTSTSLMLLNMVALIWNILGLSLRCHLRAHRLFYWHFHYLVNSAWLIISINLTHSTETQVSHQKCFTAYELRYCLHVWV